MKAHLDVVTHDRYGGVQHSNQPRDVVEKTTIRHRTMQRREEERNAHIQEYKQEKKATKLQADMLAEAGKGGNGGKGGRR